MPWIQTYDPLGNPWLSTAAAALLIVLLLVTLGVLEWRAHLAALTGLVAALVISIGVYGMPTSNALATAPKGLGRTVALTTSTSTRSGLWGSGIDSGNV